MQFIVANSIVKTWARYLFKEIKRLFICPGLWDWEGK